ncbi:dihydrodipicolinate synthase family protein [Telmatospirillum sp.]|uniref:dihydrodipicolinate synthase family protein n=1 Tax=Telmatospirillum sp. TaxID=2079197 RepID=UPI00283B6E58|nr:dihydrodipicolinate synthase family protein [Telmatospirillum sp.]MDR3441000.1 dihydrodipicolinate synthase family protein [Telmatospirillum sp.]
MRADLSGVFCAAATPVLEDYSADAKRLAAHCRQLLKDGCRGIALLGSTGEANSFSVSERMALLEAIVADGIAPDRLLPGTGVCALPDTVALTRHALSLGVSTVVMLPPFYYKGVSDDGLVDAYSYVIDRVNDPRLRVVLYHIPPISQIPIPDAVISTLIARYGQVIAGVKDSSGDLEHMAGLAETFPGLSIFAGADPLMLPLLERGGAGCITATSNLAAAQLRRIFDDRGNPDAKIAVQVAQARVVAVRTISSRFPQIPSIKAMIARRYGDDGWCALRHPFRSLSTEQRQIIGALLDELDADERASA